MSLQHPHRLSVSRLVDDVVDFTVVVHQKKKNITSCSIASAYRGTYPFPSIEPDLSRDTYRHDDPQHRRIKAKELQCVCEKQATL